VSDDVWAGAKAEFDERELVYLVSAIAMINYWNRMAITFQSTPASAAAASRALNAHVGAGCAAAGRQRAAANGLAPRTRPAGNAPVCSPSGEVSTPPLNVCR